MAGGGSGRNPVRCGISGSTPFKEYLEGRCKIREDAGAELLAKLAFEMDNGSSFAVSLGSILLLLRMSSRNADSFAEVSSEKQQYIRDVEGIDDCCSSVFATGFSLS